MPTIPPHPSNSPHARRDAHHGSSPRTPTIVAATVGTIGGIALACLIIILLRQYWQRKKLKHTPKPDEKLAERMRRWSMTTQDARKLPQLPRTSADTQSHSKRKASFSTTPSSRVRLVERPPTGTHRAKHGHNARHHTHSKIVASPRHEPREAEAMKSSTLHLENDFDALERDMSALNSQILRLQSAATRGTTSQ